jgi:hypothetical protein
MEAAFYPNPPRRQLHRSQRAFWACNVFAPTPAPPAHQGSGRDDPDAVSDGSGLRSWDGAHHGSGTYAAHVPDPQLARPRHAAEPDLGRARYALLGSSDCAPGRHCPPSVTNRPVGPERALTTHEAMYGHTMAGAYADLAETSKQNDATNPVVCFAINVLCCVSACYMLR